MFAHHAGTGLKVRKTKPRKKENKQKNERKQPNKQEWTCVGIRFLGNGQYAGACPGMWATCMHYSQEFNSMP